MTRNAGCALAVLLAALALPRAAAADVPMAAAATPSSSSSSETPTSAAPVQAAKPAAAAAAEKHEPGLLDDFVTFTKEPMGSVQYAAGVVEAGALVGIAPGGGGFSAGYHYMERGSVLAQMLFNAGSAAGAGMRAQTTGKDQTYIVDNSARSMAGLNVDILKPLASGKAGGGGLHFDLFYGIPLGNDSKPIVLDIAVTGGSWYPLAEKGKPSNAVGYFGLGLGLVLPVTRWAQIETALRASLPQKNVGWLSGHVAAVGNLNDRLYVRLDFTKFEGLGIVGGVGVKL